MNQPAAPASPRSTLRAVEQPHGYAYLLSLPEGYDAEPARRWPLLLFLHGAGDRGADVWQITRLGLPRLLAGGSELSAAEVEAAREVRRNFIVVAPQCGPHEVWDDAALLALLDHAQATYRTDPARVHLVGLSLGGFGTWSLGLRHPQRFATLVPICGGGRIADVAAAQRTRPADLRRLRVWAFHGARDYVVPLEESQRMIAALQEAGVAEARLTVYPEAEHDAWSQTFAHPALYAWLREHPRAMS